MLVYRFVRLLLISFVFNLFMVVSAFATFTPLNSVSFGPNEFGGNYDDTFKDNGVQFNLAYVEKGQSGPEFVVKKKGKVIYTKPVSSLGKYYSIHVVRIKNNDDGRIFYIVQRPSGLYGGAFSYLMGYDEKADKWQEYADIKNYYNPTGRDYHKGFTIHYGKLCAYHYNTDLYHTYNLFWDSAKNWFGFTDEGSVKTEYFQSALVYNPRYRPTYAHMDGETYVDLNSIFTWKEEGTIWVFDVDTYSVGRNSDVLGTKYTNKYMIDKSSRRAWRFDKKKETWEELPMHSCPYGYQFSSCVAINWCVQHKYGYFLGNLGGEMNYSVRHYKGN